MQKMLMAIRPEWVEKILSGEKTVELRKRKPERAGADWGKPFQVLVYCSQRKKLKNKDGVEMQGKVVAEFTCDLMLLVYDKDRKKLNHLGMKSACVNLDELKEYSQGDPVFGFHISNLKVFDQPKELRDYGVKRAPQSWVYVEDLG